MTTLVSKQEVRTKSREGPTTGNSNIQYQEASLDTSFDNGNLRDFMCSNVTEWRRVFLPEAGRLTLTALQNLYPVRKTQHSLLSADRYAGDGGNACKSRSISSLFLPVPPSVGTEGASQGGGFEALPFLTGFVFRVILLRIHDDHSGEDTRS